MTSKSTRTIDTLAIRGAREHNLQSLDLDLPHDRLVVFTGVSGSGKSSLAFDTIFREGERRYVQTMSSRARRLLGRRSKPALDEMRGVRAAIAIDQRAIVPNPRSTVGTLSEIGDELRLLFARYGRRVCPECSHEVEESSNTRSRSVECSACGFELAELSRSSLSFNREEGYCAKCRGLGLEEVVDPQRLIADPEKSLRAGALIPTRPNGYIVYSQVTPEALDAVCRAHGFSIDVPFSTLSEEQKDVVFWGSERVEVPFGKHSLESRMRWEGIKAKPREMGYYRGIARVIQETLERSRNDNVLRFVASRPCRSCDGSRLNEQARRVRLGEATIPMIQRRSLASLQEGMDSSPWSGLVPSDEDEGGGRDAIIDRIHQRIGHLVDMGLGHLELDRPAASLSSGEGRRLRLAIQLGVELRGVSYVLDEPSAGSHPAERRMLLAKVRELVDRGNSVFVVEHDALFQAAADQRIEIGPGPGVHGGRLLEDAASSSSARRPRPLNEGDDGQTEDLVLVGVRARHFAGDNFRFGLRRFNVVSGLSGSGKTTLVEHVLARRLIRDLSGTRVDVGEHESLTGAESLRKVVVVTQGEIGRSPRSNPATYSGAFDRIRALFAAEAAAQGLSLGKGDFSFNKKGGRCEHCEGAGVERIGLMNLPAVETCCPRCRGARFREAVLAVTYRGKSIRDCLDLSVEEALPHFAGDAALIRILGAIDQVGLGYLTLGQSATTLSGGEAQRLKLATELARAEGAGTLIVLDEPTSGLDPESVDRLISALQTLCDRGATVVAAEHDLRFLAAADRVIDLGPGAGPKGGRLVAMGSPAELARCEASHTGRELAAYAADGQVAAAIVEGPSTIRAQEEVLCLRGVSTRNLKNLDLDLPEHRLIAITGPSGSGKSSLAFETLAAAGRQRFAESFSPGLRREIRSTLRADVDVVRGLRPTIAIRAQERSADPRSTVGTVSGIDESLRILFARIGVGAPEPMTASDFAYNHALGACPSCDGRGLRPRCHVESLVGEGEKSLAEGVLAATRGGRFLFETEGRNHAIMAAAASAADVPLDRPWRDLDPEARALIVEGRADVLHDVHWQAAADKGEAAHRFEAAWVGVAALVESEYGKKREKKSGEIFRQLLTDAPCDLCEGSRLREASRRVRVAGRRIEDLRAEEIGSLSTQLRALCDEIDREEGELKRGVALEVVAAVEPQIERLCRLGLRHLSLDRRINTLSSGERRRVEIGAQLVEGLTAVTYVLDEPTLGLHAKDRVALTEVMRELVDCGNSVVVVEHDEEVIAGADLVVEVGPGAGSRGGEISAMHSPRKLAEDSASLWGRWRKGEFDLRRRTRNPQQLPALRLKGIHARNLKSIDVEFRFGELTGIAGVSGSGKSSLLFECLAPSIEGKRAVEACDFEDESPGAELLSARAPVFGGGPFQVVGSALGVLAQLRTLFAKSEDAKALGLKAAAFSFASKKGACPECGGRGELKVALDFLPDAYSKCRLCDGSRFDAEILECRVEGKDLGEVLALPAADLAAWNPLPAPLRKVADLMSEIGLGHLALGRKVDGLSQGESRRLALAERLLRKASDRPSVILFDEPSRGLHACDRAALLSLFERLAGDGHAVVYSEHCLDLIVAADQVLELGPGPGDRGGQVVFAGAPAGLFKAATPTGEALRTRRTFRR